MPPTMPQAEFETLLRRAGLNLPAEKIAELHTAYAHIEPMLARVRAPGRGREAELALIFRPEQA